MKDLHDMPINPETIIQMSQELAALRAKWEKARPILQCVVWDTKDITRFTIGDKGNLAKQLLEDE